MYYFPFSLPLPSPWNVALVIVSFFPLLWLSNALANFIAYRLLWKWMVLTTDTCSTIKNHTLGVVLCLDNILLCFCHILTCTYATNSSYGCASKQGIKRWLLWNRTLSKLIRQWILAYLRHSLDIAAGFIISTYILPFVWHLNKQCMHLVASICDASSRARLPRSLANLGATT